MIDSIGEQRGALENLARSAREGTYCPCKSDLPSRDRVVERLEGLCAQGVRQCAELAQSATLNLFEFFFPKSPLPFSADLRESERPVPS